MKNALILVLNFKFQIEFHYPTEGPDDRLESKKTLSNRGTNVALSRALPRLVMPFECKTAMFLKGRVIFQKLL